ncbi:hypothetical protein GCM10009846_22710 [Agrococcus versicolor]|uniref:Major facilitator superfamily (MFS) profile domain-containing protein n=1 Tax=Agrococcus versicolor TaxID=501482 RepID=A0ABP5MK19_9MICO
MLLINGQTPPERILGGMLIYAWLWAPTVLVGLAAGAVSGALSDAISTRLGRRQTHIVAGATLTCSFIVLVRVAGLPGRPGPEVWWWVYAIVIALSVAASLFAVHMSDHPRVQRRA